MGSMLRGGLDLRLEVLHEESKENPEIDKEEQAFNNWPSKALERSFKRILKSLLQTLEGL